MVKNSTVVIMLIIGVVVFLFVTKSPIVIQSVPDVVPPELEMYILEEPEFEFSDQSLQAIIKDISSTAVTNKQKD